MFYVPGYLIEWLDYIRAAGIRLSDVRALAVARFERMAEYGIQTLGHQAVADIVRVEHVARAGESSILAVGLAAVDEVNVLVAVCDGVAIGAADDVAALGYLVLMPRVSLTHHDDR